MFKKDLHRKFFWLVLFSIAMGYLESAVVIYIRWHYYPNGFDFPLVPIEKTIAITEFFREVATMIMLAAIGNLTGETKKQRFAFFVLSFAIWDIFYYVFLYVILGWPHSLMTFDVLFLIPVPWIAPVLCPVLISSLMICYSFIVIFGDRVVAQKGMLRVERLVMTIGCAIVLYSFMSDYVHFVSQHHADKGAWTLSQNKDLFSEAAGYVPKAFQWKIFIPGFVIMCGSIGMFFARVKRAVVRSESRDLKQVA
ncbi:MAG TPA: hypothetical protein VL651_04840 [Bacteroidia bacterium]|jgi:hypothetical protein|nr:hypothetical protein [Bacteroidia bacterium]